MNRCCLMMGVLLTGGVSAEDLSIQSFETDGTITFSAISNAIEYTVEASIDVVWTHSATLAATGDASVTASVSVAEPSMLYRVSATVSLPAPDGMEWIPGGTNSGTDPDVGPYALTVESFHMDRFEITKAMWDEVRRWNGGNGYSYDNPGNGKAADHPVHTVSWFDCVKWCNARSEKEGRAPAYYTDPGLTQVYRTGQILEPYVNPAAAGYRLPTGVQWEYAARGGVASRRFPWGENTIQHARANYYSSTSYSYDTSPTRGDHPDWDDGGRPFTNPTGTFEAGTNGYGLFDMAGNVWEWCSNGFPDGGGESYRMARGGSWGGNADRCRVATAGGFNPGDRSADIGFRAVLPPSQP